MRMKFTFKSLLVAAGLLMGSVNAWSASTKTLYPSGGADPVKGNFWTGNGINFVEQDDYISLSNAHSGSRYAYIKFYETGSDFYGSYESYTISFDVYSVNCWSGGYDVDAGVTVFSEGASFPSGAANTFTSANTSQKNYLLDLHNQAQWITTFKVNGAEEATITMDKEKWYNIKLDVTVTTGEVAYTVTNLSTNAVVDNGTGIYSATTDGTSIKCQGLFFQVGRNAEARYINVRNVKITTEVDEEVVDNPIVSITGVKGAERTVTIVGGESTENSTVTTYYTTDGSEPTAESGNVYSAPFTVSESCTVKAISISETGGKSGIVELYVAAGEITLNAPTFAKTAYSNGSYTVEINSNQSNLMVVPSSATIYYSIDGAAVSAYSTALQVAEGSTVTAYVVSDGYTQSETVTCETSVRPAYYVTVWSEDYREVTKDAGNGAQGVVLSESVDFTVGGINFYNIKGYGSETCNLNTNVGLSTSNNFYLRCNGNSSGILKNGGSGYLGVQNLKVGDVIVITTNNTDNIKFLTVANGLVENEGMYVNNEYYFTATATEVSLSVAPATYNYIKTITVLSPSVSVEISKAGYTTFSSEYALNLDELPEGLTAYYVADGGINESSVTVTPTTGSVKAGEGLIFKGEADKTYSVSIAETGSELEGNLLVAVATATNAPVGSYVFAYDEADLENSVGFYRVSEDYAAPVPAGKAYLSAGASEAKTLRIVFGDETATAIETVEAENEADGVLYNVAGQLVGNDYKGIVIKNGKKYLNK